MRAYKFTTKISGNGTIHLPNPALYNKEVDIIIVPKEKTSKKKDLKATDFIKKWGGFLKDTDTDRTKYEYLMGKYK